MRMLTERARCLLSRLERARAEAARLLPVVLACALPLTASCGLSDSTSEPGPCETIMAVSEAGSLLEVGKPVALQAWIISDSQTVGVSRFEWSVTLGGAPISLSGSDVEGPLVSFTPELAGVYHVDVAGAVGETGCASAREDLNVAASNARRLDFRLRMVPAPGRALPAQELIVPIHGGADASLGTLSLSRGVAAAGSVTTSEGAPVAAYVRLMPVARSDVAGAAAFTETFTDMQGELALVLESAIYDVLVVPRAEPSGAQLAPMLFAGRSPSDLDLVLEPGHAVTGVVFGPDGLPVAGARVTITTGAGRLAVPSTIALTDASGEFSLLARAGSPAALSVIPTDASVPRLELGAQPVDLVSASTSAGLPITIRYSAELGARTVAPEVLASDGTSPAPGARVSWFARLAEPAGTVTIEGGAPLAAMGAARAVSQADAAGALPPLTLVEGIYEVVIEPGSGSPPGASMAPTVRTVDVRAGVPAPASLTLAVPARIEGAVRDPEGAAIAGARITAAPVGLLAAVASAGARATSGEDGSFVLELGGDGDYELVIDSPEPRHARARLPVRVPAAGSGLDVGVLSLGRALMVTGKIVVPGSAGGEPDVSLRLYCMECGERSPGAPLAEALTGPGGVFAIAVPDPGVSTDQESRP